MYRAAGGCKEWQERKRRGKNKDRKVGHKVEDYRVGEESIARKYKKRDCATHL